MHSTGCYSDLFYLNVSVCQLFTFDELLQSATTASIRPPLCALM